MVPGLAGANRAIQTIRRTRLARGAPSEHSCRIENNRLRSSRHGVSGLHRRWLANQDKKSGRKLRTHVETIQGSKMVHSALDHGVTPFGAADTTRYIHALVPKTFSPHESALRMIG